MPGFFQAPTQPLWPPESLPDVRTARQPVLAALVFLTGTTLAALGAPDDAPALTRTIAPQAATAPSVPRAPTPAPEPEPVRRTASVVMGGDLLWHNTVWQSAAEDATRSGARRPYDFDPMFAALRPLISGADLAICHEEVPFAGPGDPLQNFPVFAAPPQIAPWIARMGFDACTTASNHAVDQGFEGLVRTADLLEASGVRHVGTFRTARERREPVILTTDDGVRIGLVAGTYGLNGFPLPEGRPWSVSLWDARNLIDQATRAREAGADIVVVHLHGGDEYSHLPNANQEALVRRLTASPAVDLVLGEHAHVVQPITRVNGKWVVYGMGNMIAQQELSQPRTYEGIAVRFEFREGSDGRFRVSEAAYVPTYWSAYAPGNPIRIRRVAATLAAGRGDTARLREAREEIREAVGGLGRPRGLRER
jgi:poly-gamma-glutamate capsule biosynthesis protein CapA/YwtB (metallophosphatase superfamily)